MFDQLAFAVLDLVSDDEVAEQISQGAVPDPRAAECDEFDGYTSGYAGFCVLARTKSALQELHEKEVRLRSAEAVPRDCDFLDGVGIEAGAEGVESDAPHALVHAQEAGVDLRGGASPAAASRLRRRVAVGVVIVGGGGITHEPGVEVEHRLHEVGGAGKRDDRLLLVLPVRDVALQPADAAGERGDELAGAEGGVARERGARGRGQRVEVAPDEARVEAAVRELGELAERGDEAAEGRGDAVRAGERGGGRARGEQAVEQAEVDLALGGVGAALCVGQRVQFLFAGGGFAAAGGWGGGGGGGGHGGGRERKRGLTSVPQQQKLKRSDRSASDPF